MSKKIQTTLHFNGAFPAPIYIPVPQPVPNSQERVRALRERQEQVISMMERLKRLPEVDCAAALKELIHELAEVSSQISSAPPSTPTESRKRQRGADAQVRKAYTFHEKERHVLASLGALSARQYCAQSGISESLIARWSLPQNRKIAQMMISSGRGHQEKYMPLKEDKIILI